MASKKNRAKYGYLSYDDMFVRIADGILDEYDVVFTTDTKECFVITPELIPTAIKSKVYVFDSIIEAENLINSNTDTYPGQIVSILCNDTYRGYIVNLKDNKYVLTALSEITEEIDYNLLGNKPIVNLVGTLDYPILLSELNAGIYSIKGQYKISSSDETIFLSASSAIFIIEKDENATNIKKITSHEVRDYKIENDEVTSTFVITQAYLSEQGYTTEKYVDEKISTLDVLTKNESKDYIEELVSSVINEEIDTIVDQKIDEKIEEKLQPTLDEDVLALFNINGQV